MKIEWASALLECMFFSQPMTLLAFLTPEHKMFLLVMALFVPLLLAIYWYVSRGEDEPTDDPPKNGAR